MKAVKQKVSIPKTPLSINLLLKRTITQVILNKQIDQQPTSWMVDSKVQKCMKKERTLIIIQVQISKASMIIQN